MFFVCEECFSLSHVGFAHWCKLVAICVSQYKRILEVKALYPRTDRPTRRLSDYVKIDK